MAVHGTERQAQRDRDYIHTELMDVGMRISAAEERLRAVSQRLAEMEELIRVSMADAVLTIDT